MSKTNTPTIIVAGCTRSGMTLMMQLLHKGGYPCFGTWPAFENYIVGEIDWQEARGKAVKLVDTHRQFPPEGEYYVLRMHRDPVEQAKSTIKFMKTLGLPLDRLDTKGVMESLKKDLDRIDSWAYAQEKCLPVRFEELLSKPSNVIAAINKMFGIQLPEDAASCVVQRSPKCFDGMLESIFNSDDSKTFNMKRYKMGRCDVLVSIDNGKWHMSISTPNASPSYREIKEARYRYLPNNITMAQLFPPREGFLNAHPYCHHLWQVNEENI